MKRLVVVQVLCALLLSTDSTYGQYGSTAGLDARFFWSSIRTAPPLSLEHSIPTATLEWEARTSTFNVVVGRILGLLPTPTKTPLNAQVVLAISSTVNGMPYRIFNVAFESEPKNYVTANLYLPIGVSTPLPCVIFNHGHGGGKTSYSHMAMALATFGIAAFVMDCIGYGERVMTSYPEHDTARLYPLVAGGLRRIITWENIRALDYLESRGDIDMTRIGWAGNSGGGTGVQFMCVAGLYEPRGIAYAPAGAISSWESMTWPTSGHCQCNVVCNIARYMDHADTLGMVVQRGGHTMILTGTQDELQATQTDPLGTGRTAYDNCTRTAQNLSRLCDVYGYAGSSFPTIVCQHGMTDIQGRPKREALYGFMARTLLSSGTGQPIPEPYVPDYYNDPRLNCYPSGAVPTDAADPYQLIARHVRSLKDAYILPYDQNTYAAWREQTKERIITDVFGGWPSTAPFNERMVSSGIVVGCRWKKYIIETERSMLLSPPTSYAITVPVWVLQPTSTAVNRPVVVALYEDGVTGLFTPSSAPFFMEPNINLYISSYGFTVVCVDVRSIGENFVHWMNDYELGKWSSLYGKPMFGRQVWDVVRALDWVESQPEINTSTVAVIGFGASGKKLGAMLALYAGALDDRIRAVVAEGGLASYEEPLEWSWWFTHWFIPVFVTPYADVPQIAALVAPRPLAWVAPESANQSKNKLTYAEVDALMTFTRNAYQYAGAPSENLRIIAADAWDGLTPQSWASLNAWLVERLHGSRPVPSFPGPGQTFTDRVTFMGGSMGYIHRSRDERLIVHCRPKDRGEIRMRVYTLRGARIWEEVRSGAPEETVTFAWHGTDSAGSPVATGMYVVGITGGGLHETRRVALIR
jgi:cephalosporin-C deacetylase-like acetyl esterase